METAKLANVEELQYFVGKVCTIITPNINWAFDKQQTADYFSGIVEKITPQGVWTIHVITKLKNFYPLHNIMAIIEEQYVSADDPNYEAIMTEYVASKKPKPQQQSPLQPTIVEAPPPPPTKSSKVDIDKLEALVSKNSNK
jgi:hypothetical protein